ncbi:MAG: YbbR-like domain-containing protein [Ignavibacteriales bacterium]
MKDNGRRIWEILNRMGRTESLWWDEVRSLMPVIGETVVRGLKSLFLKNRGKKILAVAFAVALWFSANIEQDVERGVSAEVNYTNLPADLAIMNDPPQTLNLRVRGPRTQLSSLSPRDTVFTLDLSHATPGVSKFEIRTDQIKPPSGVQVIGISPAEIRIDIDKIIEKEVTVKPAVSIPDTGYEIVGEPKVTPSKVRIRGPKRVVSQVESVSTDLVSTAGVKSSFTIEVPLKPPPGVEIIEKGFARVTVNLQERTVIKEFKDMNISLLNSDGVQFEPLEPLKAELVFEGPYRIIKDLNSDNIEVSVDASKLKQNSRQKVQKLKVNVNYPYRENLTLKKKVPDEIQVILRNSGG